MAGVDMSGQACDTSVRRSNDSPFFSGKQSCKKKKLIYGHELNGLQSQRAASFHLTSLVRETRPHSPIRIAFTWLALFIAKPTHVYPVGEALTGPGLSFTPSPLSKISNTSLNWRAGCQTEINPPGQAARPTGGAPVFADKSKVPQLEDNRRLQASMADR